MKSDIVIKDNIYSVLKGSLLVAEVGGELRKTQRPTDSRKEDVCISVMSNDDYHTRQVCYAWVRIYVPDVLRGGQWEENSKRLRQLAGLADQALSVHNGGDYRWTLESMTTTRADENEHVICCKLLYVQNND